jgi:2-dehydropantoate 2-reductase|tara:strand:+ start:103 stop:996 length:894 start_codon:yes stop_codon:yes gene_type:complete
MSAIRSLIAGPGAIGALACAQAQLYGPVWAYAHRPKLTLATECRRTPASVPLLWQPLSAAEDTVELIWICCKAYQAQATTEVLLNRFPNAVAILLHNGMGPQQQLAKQFPGRLIWGTTTCGALRLNPHTFQQTGYGTSHLGMPPGSPDQSPAAAMLARLATWHGPLNPMVTEHIEALLWQKLLINAVLNPITAAHQIRNGQLLEPAFAAEIDGLCGEIGQLMQHLKQPAIANPRQLIHKVATLTAENRSSMAEDVRTGRPTEIDYITGFLLHQAQGFGLATPFLAKWHKQIAQAGKS